MKLVPLAVHLHVPLHVHYACGCARSHFHVRLGVQGREPATTLPPSSLQGRPALIVAIREGNRRSPIIANLNPVTSHLHESLFTILLRLADGADGPAARS